MERHLYVPSKVVSWDAQVTYAHKLAKQGNVAYVHRHAWGASCLENVAPNEGCVRVELTADGTTTNVLPVSEARSESENLT